MCNFIYGCGKPSDIMQYRFCSNIRCVVAFASFSNIYSGLTESESNEIMLVHIKAMYFFCQKVFVYVRWVYMYQCRTIMGRTKLEALGSEV